MAMNSAMDTTELLGGFEQVQHSVQKNLEFSMLFAQKAR